MRQPVRWFGLAMVVAVAAWLRLAGLADRPMHADEANQAVKLGNLLESGEYRFDPRDHHGPTLYYLGLIPAWVRGQTTLAALDETTVRFTPAIAGVLGVLFLGLLLGRVSTIAGWVAAALLAVSPIAVYYSRYFIQETLLSAFFLLGLYAGVRWREARAKAQGRAWAWAVVTGFALGFMLATKATAPLFVTLSLLAFAAAWWGDRRARADRPAREHLGVDQLQILAGLAVAVLVAAGFYSSFLRNPEGLRDAIRTYALMGERVAGGNAHDKPGLYYLELLGRQTSGGYTWNQLPASLLGLAGLGLVIARRGAAGVFAAVFGLAWFAVVSITPYKTPWILIHGIPVLAAWTALGVHALAGRGRAIRFLSALVVLGVLGWQLSEVRMTVFRRPADPRNPLAYVHTSPDVLRVRQLAGPDQPGPIRVISPEYWPLPWYLRGRHDVGYWNQVPDPCDAGLLFVAPERAASVRERLSGTYEEGYLGLRPGVILQVFRRTQDASQRP